MAESIRCSSEDSFVVEGKLALPYQYFAGRTGSRFLRALRDEKKILGIKCGKCGKVYVPPRKNCEKHIAEELTEWVELPGTGTVTGFTIIRYEEPYQPVTPPYILALIKLEGADSALTHIVKGIQLSKMRVGLKVKPVFAKKPPSTILAIDHFKAEDGPKYKLGYSYDELEIGMTDTFSKTVSETDVYLFAGITGDFNPMHVNEEYAATTPFGKRIAHGAIPQSLIAPVLGMKLPGLGTVAYEVHVRFKAPTYFGDTITARATVAEKLPRNRVRLDCEWTNQDGQLIAEGYVVAIPPPKVT